MECADSNSFRVQLMSLIPSRFGPLAARFKGDLALTAASMLTPLAQLVGSVVITRCVDPKEMGIITTVMLIPTYFGFLHLGVFNGLTRNVPILLGQGDRTRAQQAVDDSWTVVKITTWLGAVIAGACLLFFHFRHYSSLYEWSLVLAGLTLCTEPAFTHLDGIYRSCRQNAQLAKILLWQNLAAFATNILPAFVGAAGVIVSRSAQAVIRVFLRTPANPMRACKPGTLSGITQLGWAGMPLLISCTVYTYLGVADRSVVAFLMTEEDVGRLSLANTAINAIQALPMIIGTVFYPRILARYGRTGTSRSLRGLFWLSLAINVAIVVPVSLAGYWCVGPLTHAYFPKYVPGIEAARIACLGCMAFVYFGITGIIAAVNKNTPYIVSMGVTLAVIWGLGAWMIHAGHGIEGAAWARAVGSAILCVLTLIYAYYLTAKDIRPNA